MLAYLASAQIVVPDRGTKLRDVWKGAVEPGGRTVFRGGVRHDAHHRRNEGQPAGGGLARRVLGDRRPDQGCRNEELSACLR